MSKVIAIHCETKDEFNRVLDLYKCPEKTRELLYWDYYGSDTVFYPELEGESFVFGDINGYAKDINAKIVKSTVL